MRSSLRLFLLVVISLVAQRTCGQNLESIGKEKPFAVNGGASLSQLFYTARGIESRRDPYVWYASGNLNLSIYGWSVPLSFSYSNQQRTFQQPFNQYSLHPTYKWITAHAGYTSMSFSPYTVAGHIFLGGGVDVAPEGKWRFSGLYGRFLKPVPYDSANQNAITSYRRMGYGFKASYGTGKDFIDLILFHAQDDIHSIPSVPDSLSVMPQENLVLSVGAGKTVFKKFLLKSELASSALSGDTRAGRTEISHPLAKLDGVYTPRLSSSFYNAFKTSFDFQHDMFMLGVAYERIDPQYRTLGAYYFNSDLENITINATASLLQGQMNIAASAGTQHDNLDRTKVSTMQRAVGSVNVNYAPSQRFNVSGSYSNFQTYTNIRSQFQRINQLTPFENLDTLNFTQLSQNASLSTLYTFGRNENRKQNLNLNFTVQDASDKQGDVPQNSGMRFYNFNTAYAVNFVPTKTTLSASLNATLNSGAGLDSKTYGPVVSLSRAFFDRKLRTVFSSSYNRTYADGLYVNRVVNGRASANVVLQKKHAINVSAVVLNRSNRVESGMKSFTEFTGNVGYSYSFSSRR